MNLDFNQEMCLQSFTMGKNDITQEHPNKWVKLPAKLGLVKIDSHVTNGVIILQRTR